jgi:hypothetical protein
MSVEPTPTGCGLAACRAGVVPMASAMLAAVLARQGGSVAPRATALAAV